MMSCFWTKEVSRGTALLTKAGQLGPSIARFWTKIQSKLSAGDAKQDVEKHPNVPASTAPRSHLNLPTVGRQRKGPSVLWILMSMISDLIYFSEFRKFQLLSCLLDNDFIFHATISP